MEVPMFHGKSRRDPLARSRLLDSPGVAAALALGLGLASVGLGLPGEVGVVGPTLLLLVLARRAAAERARLESLCETLAERALSFDAAPLEVAGEAPAAAWLARWHVEWPTRAEAGRAAETLIAGGRALPGQIEAPLGRLAAATERQEEAVEETASLIANMRQSMREVADQIEHLLHCSDQSASSVLELGASIDDVADNTAKLHELVDASTRSVHEMGASIRQVASSAEQLQEMAESTATSVSQMDRSIQEVSSHANEAAALTERAHEGASEGRIAVHATIDDIERISTLTTDAMHRLDGLVQRVSQIGSILGAIDEINDETNLLSLNAAIIAAQAGEQGKAFRVVANHVKTLARRTATSTQDIERLIRTISEESRLAVEAMGAGIEAVQKGVARSQGAGEALESIQEACSAASERVTEIARATSEQSRNSKGVAESTQRTSEQIQQIGAAIAEQRKASDAMRENSESALVSCQHVARATDEQRSTSRQITTAIASIGDLIREVGGQTRNHTEASESTSEAVVWLLDNAREAAANIAPVRRLVEDFAATVPAPAAASADESTQPPD